MGLERSGCKNHLVDDIITVAGGSKPPAIFVMSVSYRPAFILIFALLDFI